jgi:fructokinase
VISFDPNIRPGFIKDREAHLARMNRMAAMSDIIKFSDEDLAWFGMEGSHDTLAVEWLKRGPKLVVITRGADGAVGYTRNHKVEVASQRVMVVDTVGAGDTFDAGVLASLKLNNLLTKEQVANLSDEAIRQALALGAKAAAVTVSRAGANPPWKYEIGL